MSSENTGTRVALLIDADNVGDNHAEFMFKHATAYGNVIVREAYSVMSGGQWKKESLFKYAIEPVMRPAYTSGKNSTDIVLVIGAMDLAYRKIVDVICIASNDSDFSPLAMKLRKSGVKVCGFGSRVAASEAFINSCDEFHYLPDEVRTKIAKPAGASNEDATQSASENESQTPADFPVAKHLADAVEMYGDANGWANLGAAGNYLLRINPAFSPKNHGASKLMDLVKKIGGFDMRDTPKDPKIKKKD